MLVQYNPFGDLNTLLPEDNRIFNDSDGSIIAVSYEARAHGVKRCLFLETSLPPFTQESLESPAQYSLDHCVNA